MTISIIIPVHNSGSTLDRCLQGLRAAAFSDYECIVVDDGSTDDSAEVADRYATRLLRLPGPPRGPAYARNRGAEVARGDILLFLDADVVVHPDALAIVADTFARHPEVDAVFGSYDDNPEGGEFLSRYKNLFHHFVHQQGGERAVTFWSGCGAVRREVFLRIGGYDEVRYPRPSIEDVELGYRLRFAGHKTLLNKALQVQHLKRWTLRGMITTDVFGRGIPWTELLMQEGRLPNTLNLHISQRVSAALVSAVIAYLGLIVVVRNTVLLPLVAALFLLVAGTWSAGTPHFHMNRRARILAYLLIALIGVIAVQRGEMRIPWLLIPFIFAMLVDRWLPNSNRFWQRVAFGVMVLAMLTCAVLLAKTFTLRLGAPIVLVLFLVMVINRRLYVFFARRQGVLFALTVLPFHLFYYLYSLLAFVAGVVIYLSRRHASSPGSLRPLAGVGTPSTGREAAAAGPLALVPAQSASGRSEEAPRPVAST